MRSAVLALNAGSSSLKLAAFEVEPGGGLRTCLRAETTIGADGSSMVIRNGDGATVEEGRWPGESGREDVMRSSLEAFGRALREGPVLAVGHRIVHGGPDLREPAVLDRETVARLTALTAWAPLHQPQSLAMLESARQSWPGAVQIGCFDTAFHHDQPPAARRFALPRTFEAEGLRRYGFHGLSCQSALTKLARLDPQVAAGRLLIAHLGSGCSISAVVGGRSVDSSMGFSPLDGLVMSTRCGSLDPGVILFLELERGMTASQVEDLLYHRAGLLGVSGVSGDMRILLASRRVSAKEAVELFEFRAAREAAALAGSMQGLDGVVFTGGVGENAPSVRANIAARLGWLGLSLDDQLNQSGGDRLISAPDSRVRAWVLAADEEMVIARACAGLAAGPAA